MATQHRRLGPGAAGVFVAAFFLANLVQPAAAGRKCGGTRDRVSEVLNWLPADTETLLVERGPFTIAESLSDAALDELAEKGETLPEGTSLMGLTVPKDDQSARQLLGKTVLLVAEGSRGFRDPTSLGPMRYEGCIIALFDAGGATALAKVPPLLSESADRTMEIDGTTVAVFEEKFESDIWTLYYVVPQRGVLLLATHEGYLRDVLARMRKRSPTRALPSDLPEWKQVDSTARFWGIRHYRKATASIDPSSPLREQAAANVPDPEAIGVVFFYDPERSPVATVRYLTGSDRRLEIVKERWWMPPELEPAFSTHQKGVVDIRVRVTDIEVECMFFFVLMAYLGHAVYV